MQVLPCGQPAPSPLRARTGVIVLSGPTCQTPAELLRREYVLTLVLSILVTLKAP